MYRVLIFFLLISPAAAQTDCSATLLGQVGCGGGTRPFVESMGDTLGSRGNGWYESDPQADDGYRGTMPYTKSLGVTTDDDGYLSGESYGSGTVQCGTVLTGPCDY